MLCDRCHGREAVVHVTQIVNGHRTERHLQGNAQPGKTQNNSMGFFGHDLFRNSFDTFFNDGLIPFFRPCQNGLSKTCPNRNAERLHHDFKRRPAGLPGML